MLKKTRLFGQASSAGRRLKGPNEDRRLSYQYSGREIRLTDLAGQVAKDVVA
jgi:hypothetical protein